MKAIVNTAEGRLEWRELPSPQPDPGQVRIRTAACGICATDLQMIAGWDRTGFPSIPGHEWSGTVDAVGAGVDRALIGTRCVAENVRADGGEVGFEHPGGYAEAFVTEARNIHSLPDDLPFDVATLIEPMAVAVRGLRRLRLEDRRRALVLGDGPVGLLMVLLLRRAAVSEIVLAGGRLERLRIGQALGAKMVVNYHDLSGGLGDLGELIGWDSPNVIEASGSEGAAGMATALVGPEGKVLILGDYGAARAGFRWNRLLHRQIELIGSNASAGGWPEAVRVAQAEKDPLQRMITHRLPASEFAQGIEWMRGRVPGLVKVVLMWK